MVDFAAPSEINWMTVFPESENLSLLRISSNGNLTRNRATRSLLLGSLSYWSYNFSSFPRRSSFLSSPMQELSHGILKNEIFYRFILACVYWHLFIVLWLMNMRTNKRIVVLINENSLHRNFCISQLLCYFCSVASSCGGSLDFSIIITQPFLVVINLFDQKTSDRIVK